MPDAVKVKPLVWQKKVAETAFGEYVIYTRFAARYIGVSETTLRGHVVNGSRMFRAPHERGGPNNE